MMMLSETPAMLSVFPKAAASKRWSVVFSNEASMSTLSFILATPNRVIPRTSPFAIVRMEKRWERYAHLVGHDVSEKGDVTGVDAHAVWRHRVLNLVDDRPARRLDTKDLGNLHDMVGRGILANNAYTRVRKHPYRPVRDEPSVVMTFCKP
jgi:hypothetical protein